MNEDVMRTNSKRCLELRRQQGRTSLERRALYADHWEGSEGWPDRRGEGGKAASGSGDGACRGATAEGAWGAHRI